MASQPVEAQQQSQAAPIPPTPPPCRFFNRPSGCRNGHACRFSHVLAICKHGSISKCEAAKTQEKETKSEGKETMQVEQERCPLAHWQKCENVFCFASTIRRFCKFCWRSRRKDLDVKYQQLLNFDSFLAMTAATAPATTAPATTMPTAERDPFPPRYLRRCASAGCHYLTPYLFCGPCFYSGAYENTRAARQKLAEVQRTWCKTVIQQLREKGLVQQANAMTKALEASPPLFPTFQIPVDLLFVEPVQTALAASKETKEEAQNQEPEKEKEKEKDKEKEGRSYSELVKEWPTK